MISQNVIFVESEFPYVSIPSTLKETNFSDKFNFGEVMPIHGQHFAKPQVATGSDPPYEDQVVEQLPLISWVGVCFWSNN